MKTRSGIAFLTCFVLTCLYACVEPYEVRYQLNANLLSVEGFVSDQPGTNVSISIGRNVNQSYYSEAVSGCTAEIRTGDGKSIPLQEVSAGLYAAPSTFKGLIGESYQLFFRMPNGNTYQSPKEVLRSTPEIKNTFQQYNPNGILDNTGTRVFASTVDIYLEFDDPKEIQNAYLWRWKLWEEQGICLTCYGGRLGPNGKCVSTIGPLVADYDYSCDRECWEILYNKNINILNDNFINGRSVAGKLVAQIPFYSPNRGALIEIEQLGISKEAYDYFQLISNQTQSTGTLTDTPPAAIIGNIQNVKDPQEKIVGYFGAASSRKVLYWITREGYPDPIVTTLLGHQINMDVSPSPTFPCVLSKDRTPIRPEGWR
jgi:hypothetical protein